MIYIGFSTSNSIISKVIRWFTKSTVSHTFFVFKTFDQYWVLESDWLGVVITPLKKFQKSNKIKALLKITTFTENDIGIAMDDLGLPYDYSGLIGNIFPIIGKWFKKKWSNPLNNSKAMFCSEFVTTCLRDTHFPGSEDLDPAITTPQDLLDFLFKHHVSLYTGTLN